MGRIVFLTALSLLSLVISCDRADKGVDQAPKVPKSSAPGLGNKTDTVAGNTNAEIALPIGRWRSKQVCLEIFANRDFEISLPTAKTGKELVMGRASLSDKTEEADKGFNLILQTESIWRARWVSRCRKVHNLGDWIEESTAFGVAVAKGSSLSLRMRPLGEKGIEVCPTDESGQVIPCTTLLPDKPLLGTNWKGGDEDTIKLGAIVSIEIGAQGHIALRETDDGQSRIYGSLLPTHVSGDEFALVFTPIKDRIKGEPAILGEAVGERVEFTATRLAGQQVKLCISSDNCVRLDREFDSYAYKIDYHPDE